MEWSGWDGAGQARQDVGRALKVGVSHLVCPFLSHSNRPRGPLDPNLIYTVYIHVKAKESRFIPKDKGFFFIFAR